MIIAIDGPSGVGKGTVARGLAAALGIRHVDTGGMYRALAWRGTQLGLDLDNEDVMTDLAEHADFRVDGSQIWIDGTDVSEAIRTPEIDKAVTRVARLSRVRAQLVARQRAMAANGGVVMEGRDIGSVVFPDADVKVFLDASPEERARRRANDPAHTAAKTQSAADLAQAMKSRDESDRNRAASPLKVPEGAIVIDTTSIPAADVVVQVLAIIKAKQ
jgi:cytidylate kinase